MYKHLINFVDKNDILYKYQFGFRRQHSTNYAITSFVEKITNALDKGNVVVSCFLDLKKAFDTVNHRILISKWRKYGRRGHIFQWFESFLKKLVIYRVGLQVFKNNLGYIPKAVESHFITNSDINKYNTRYRDKM